MWIIQAQVETVSDAGEGRRWTGSRQVPSFVIDHGIQGAATREAAERIAREVLNPAGLIPDERIHVHVMAWNPAPSHSTRRQAIERDLYRRYPGLRDRQTRGLSGIDRERYE